MKRWICVWLALCILCCGSAMTTAAAAEPEKDVISLYLHSDVAGCTEKDADKLLEIRSPQVEYYNSSSCPVSIATASGGGEYAHMEAGRQYTITYTLVAADGYTLPETIDEVELAIECGKGVKVLSSRIAELYVRRDENGKDIRVRVLRILANVVVDSTVLQRIIGWFKDLYLKIRWWQLY